MSFDCENSIWRLIAHSGCTICAFGLHDLSIKVARFVHAGCTICAFGLHDLCMQVARFVHVHRNIVHLSCIICACACLWYQYDARFVHGNMHNVCMLIVHIVHQICAFMLHDLCMCIKKLCIYQARFVHVHVYRSNVMHDSCMGICTMCAR